MMNVKSLSEVQTPPSGPKSGRNESGVHEKNFKKIRLHVTRAEMKIDASNRYNRRACSCLRGDSASKGMSPVF